MTEEYFEHHLAYTTVRIAVKTVAEKLLTGTGFFYLANITLGDKLTRSKLLLVSCKHVLCDGKGEMTLNINRKKEDGSPDYGNIRTFNFNLEIGYFAHPNPNVDLACIDVSSITHTDAHTPFFNNEFLTPINHERVVLGNKALFVGYPEDYYDNVNNLPLVRQGILASMASVDFKNKGEIIIDAQVFPGSSGSPVFVDWDQKYRLLGVLSKSIVRSTSQPLGLGVVIKQRHVQELIDYAIDEVKKKYNKKYKIVLSSS